MAKASFIGDTALRFHIKRQGCLSWRLMMNKKILVTALCGVAIAIPALAAMEHGDMSAMHAGPMTKAAVEAKIKAHFAKVDANSDGYIIKTEADAAHTNMMGEKRDRHFKSMDANSDGSISRAEFDAQHGSGAAGGEGHDGEHQGGMMRHGSHMGRHMALMGNHMFERADADKDGRVSLAEALVKPMAHFDKVDANKDGTITPEERKAAHEKMRAE